MYHQHKLELPSKIKGLLNLQEKRIEVPAFDYFFGDLKNVERQITRILESLEIPTTGISIRSASMDEDTKTNSNAGKYLSFNNLQSFDEIVNASKAIIRDFQEKNNTSNPCHILIQKTVASMYSGVTFASYHDDLLKIYTESFFGGCRTVVDGITTPYISHYNNETWRHLNNTGDQYHQFITHPTLFDKTNFEIATSGNILLTSLSDFPKRIRYFQKTMDNEISVYGNCPRKAPNFFIEKLLQLHAISSSFTSEYPNGIDMEWGIDKQGKLYIFQIRDLTSPIDFEITSYTTEIEKTPNILKGIPASKGKLTGVVVYKNSNLQLPKGAKKILMLKEANVENTNNLKAYDGIICTYGGMLSHLAIVSRELQIPCIVGVRSIIPEMTSISMDCNKGIIKLM
ncbi:hypothetical protein KORDIASMS9_01276 [Kordia sp. SMS9]|uniref:PEP/pyruvate-binding domain-containing protein n=1 Tax=Kordia sp. SMS9 TaxID=2282170 RepID=UPI000E0D348E|nr:PEP/pyruvate-binding domain-containing protein [Kordia sp. SMS9]AXG69057.1 hypothetical protein KORDIASMS9_01276 [Kordia sp. SMS9]